MDLYFINAIGIWKREVLGEISCSPESEATAMRIDATFTVLLLFIYIVKQCKSTVFGVHTPHWEEKGY